MPKRLYQIKDFSGGLNNLKDPADIADNEVADVSNLTFTKQGAIGGAFNMKNATNNLLAAYDTSHIDHIEAGYGLGYFETDYVRDSVTVEYDSDTLNANNGFDLLEEDGTARISSNNDTNNKRLNLKVGGTATNLASSFPVGTRILLSPVSTASRTFAQGKLNASAQGIYTVVGVASNDIILDRQLLGNYGEIANSRFSLNIKGFASGDKILLLAHPDEHKIDTYSTNNSVLTVDDLTPTPSAAWQASQSHTGATGTSNLSGSGLTCSVATDGSGNPTFTITLVGTGYVVDEEITFIDPGSTTNTAVLVVASANNWELDSITLRSSATGINSKVLYHKIDDSIRCFDTADKNDCKVQWYGWIQREHFIDSSGVVNGLINSHMGYFAKNNDLAKPTDGTCVDGATTPAISTFANAGAGFDFNISTNTSTEGLIRAGDYVFAQSFIYDDNQESLLTDYSISNFNVAEADDFKVFSVNVGVTAPFDPRISGGRIYIKEKNSDSEYLLLIDINLTKGCRTNLTDEYTVWLDRGSSTYSCPTGTASDNFIIKDLNFINYETINGYPPSIFSNALGDQGEFWKDSTVSNNRVFICNVSMKDEESGTSKSNATIKNYPDRIMYSMPNRYDTFPSFNTIEAAKGDADYYVAIESFADRILAYKQYSLDIINIASPSDANWFLEDSKNYMGIEFHGAVAKTQYGIVWVNKQGLYFYDGSKIRDLSENKIDDSIWHSFVTVNSMIIYDEATNLIYVVKNCSSDGDAYLYDLKKGNFTYLKDFTHDGITNVVHTNFSDSTNALVGTDAGSSTRFYKLHRGFQSVENPSFQTKDFDFGNAAKVKKIYAVYLTYQELGDQIDGTFTLVEDDGTSHSLSGAIPENSDGTYNTVKLTPSSPVICNKISIKMALGDGDESLIQINDISIEYREIHKRSG